MSVFKEVKKNFNFAKEEENILDLWDKLDVFKRSISQRKNKKASSYTFYDGPPFATGLPHYGHIVASSIKDTVARYFTMKGHYVERRFGWDTHGLPIEMETEKKLGLSGPSSIREYGIAKFNEACRSGVLTYTKEWRQVIRRIGRFVDFDNDYKTMDVSFMESVWWVFGQLWQKNLVYKGFRVMPYSVRLSTPLSNFEANLNYQTVQDPSLTIKVALKEDKNTFLLVWTTTPWTLPANLAIAVGKDIAYVKIQNDDGSCYIMAKNLVANLFKDKANIIQELSAQDLIGLAYEPIYDHEGYKNLGKDLEKCFVVIESSHVTTQTGSGLVHMAPCFGVDDYEACLKNNLPIFDPIDEEGNFLPLIKELAGQNFKDADKLIIKTLKEQKKVFSHSTIDHSYPFCWRSNTPLMYKAMPVWFIDVPKIKERMSQLNTSIHWVPEAIGHKRFANWLLDAQEWSVSRNRFWGTPIPIWQCRQCDHKVCISSIQELEKLTNSKITDLHSHFIDDLKFDCEKCSCVMTRISEVFDCWFESGSMPVAQIHYPFENKDILASTLPADFIAEGLDQTRGWFYTLLVISTALFDKPPFKNVVVNGMVLASDGSKMSKSKQNYPDPKKVIDDYGSDALRTYLLGSPVVRAEPLLFSEEGVKEVVRSVLLPLYNCWSFFVSYANMDSFDPKTDLAKALPYKERAEIDRWILSKLQSLLELVNQEMDNYYLYKTIDPMLSFIDDLTNWYIRRSRRRFWKNASNQKEIDDKISAYATLYEVLVTLAKTLAPMMPFISEELYQSLVVDVGMHKKLEDSIHLCDFEQPDPSKVDKDLEAQVDLVRQVVWMARALREKHRINTRQPLAKITVVSHKSFELTALMAHKELILSELNVRDLVVLDDDENLCTLCAKANYKTLGPRFGTQMKDAVAFINNLDAKSIKLLESGKNLVCLNQEISIEDVLITRLSSQDVVVLTKDHVTVALDTHITQDLYEEGLMREALSLLQKLRKDNNLEVSDRINLDLYCQNINFRNALERFKDYLSQELLVINLTILSQPIPAMQKLIVKEEELFVTIAKN